MPREGVHAVSQRMVGVQWKEALSNEITFLGDARIHYFLAL
jgi:hypothetical protein